MTTLLSLATLALAGTAHAAHPGMKAIRQLAHASNTVTASNVSLTPITVNTTAPSPECFEPHTDVILPYGTDNTSIVNITLTVPAAVLLEAVTPLTAVDCAEDSVALTFKNAAMVNAAFTAWSAFESLVLITNHMGDCDTEHERGFFVASTFAIDNLTLVAGVEKTNVTNVASYLSAHFTGMPAASSAVTKRDIVGDPAAFNLSTSWDFPNLTLPEVDPSITATANGGGIDVGLTLDGYLDFDVWSFSLDALYVDIAAAASIDLELGLAVTAAYNDSFAYADAVTYYVVDIPGILSFGPALNFAVGASVDADTAVDLTLGVGAGFNGTVHLDFVDNDTTAAGWTPTYYADLNFSNEAAVVATPYVEVTLELDFEILGGILDLSGGLTPRVEFPTTATLLVEKAINATALSNVTITQPSVNGTCANGVRVDSDFGFTLDAFITQFYDVELYSVSVPIADDCYSLP